MKVSVKGLSFGFGERLIFKDLSFETGSAGSAGSVGTGSVGANLPLVILGPSGCGKTTLLRLIAGLLEPSSGEVAFNKAPFAESSFGESSFGESSSAERKPAVSFVFQEPRLLPHLSILKNTALPLEKLRGKDEAARLASRALDDFMLGGRMSALPGELSGGERQRASLARAFAYPSEAVLMDEPFQSLDVPLRLFLMETVLSRLAGEKRLCVIVTHDPREAVYLGGRAVVLGPPPSGAVYSEDINLPKEERRFGSAAAGEIERRLTGYLAGALRRPV